MEDVVNIADDIDAAGLLKVAKGRFKLGPNSLHGPKHWQAVRRNGLVLADALGADADVVEAFALLHDCCREDEGHDPLHGHRAAEFAEVFNGCYFNFEADRLELLMTAIRDHNGGQVSSEPTLDACWSADRIELPRVGIKPSRRFFTAGSWDVYQTLAQKRRQRI